MRIGTETGGQAFGGGETESTQKGRRESELSPTTGKTGEVRIGRDSRLGAGPTQSRRPSVTRGSTLGGRRRSSLGTGTSTGRSWVRRRDSGVRSDPRHPPCEAGW